MGVQSCASRAGTQLTCGRVQGIIVYRGTYFGMYDTAKGALFKDEKTANFFAKWAVAQTVTALAGVTSYPFDTVRRRLMMQARSRVCDGVLVGLVAPEDGRSA